MKNFELRPIYYPKGSYLNYILEIWVDGVNISQFYEDNKLRIDVGYIFHIYNYFDNISLLKLFILFKESSILSILYLYILSLSS